MIEIDAAKCTACGNCYDVCPNRVIEARGTDDGKTFLVRYPEQCCACGHCMATCAPRAISHRMLSYDDFCDLDEIDVTPESLRNLLLARRSVRKYREDPVPEDILDDLIEVATHAGTGSNLQSVGFIVITDRALLRRLERSAFDILWDGGLKFARNQALSPILRFAYGEVMAGELKVYHDIYKHRLANGQLEGTIFRNAPAVILAHDLKQNMAGHENCALALRNIETLAVAMGLGTCWVGLFTAAANRKPRKINPLLGLDNSRRVFGALMIGYPKHRSRMRIPRNAREVTYL